MQMLFYQRGYHPSTRRTMENIIVGSFSIKRRNCSNRKKDITDDLQHRFNPTLIWKRFCFLNVFMINSRRGLHFRRFDPSWRLIEPRIWIYAGFNHWKWAFTKKKQKPLQTTSILQIKENCRRLFVYHNRRNDGEYNPFVTRKRKTSKVGYKLQQERCYRESK